jgi:hypothetical protein
MVLLVVVGWALGTKLLVTLDAGSEALECDPGDDCGSRDPNVTVVRCCSGHTSTALPPTIALVLKIVGPVRVTCSTTETGAIDPPFHVPE